MKLLVLQHEPYEGPGRYSQFAREAGIMLETVELWKPGYEMPAPSEYKNFDAAIIMGGSQGVNDPASGYPSRHDEVRFIQTFDRPQLGHCLGSQLMSYANGGRVYKGDIKECGFYTVKLTPQGKQSPIFRGLEEQIDVFHWHGDVFTIPEGATPLAVSEYDGSVQAFSIDGKVAMLFHLEMYPNMLDGLFDGTRGWFKSGMGFKEHHGNTEEDVKRRAVELDSQMERNARRVFGNFVSIVQAQN